MSGDLEFEDLVQAWYDRLYRFAYSLTGRREDALDLTQNAFLKWARKRQTVRKKHKAKSKSWLFTVLYREFLDQARPSPRFPNVELNEEILQQNEGGRAPAPSRFSIGGSGAGNPGGALSSAARII